MCKRNTNIEILRLILMIFILFWHIIMHGMGFKDIGNTPPHFIWNSSIVCLLLTAFSPSVYCFIFISGFYGIKFSIQKVLYLVFIGFCCMCAAYIFRFYAYEDLSIGSLVRRFFSISQGRWWFLTYYVILLIISPILQAGINCISYNQFKQLIIILTLMQILNFISFVPDSGSTLFGMMYMYLLGRYISISDLKYLKGRRPYYIYAISFWALFFILLFFSSFPNQLAKMAYYTLGYNNPLIMLMAISLFVIVNKLDTSYNRFVNMACLNVIIIYLFTEGVGVKLYVSLVNLLESNLLYGFIFVFVILISCIIWGFMLDKIFNYFCKNIKLFEIYEVSDAEK